ncbi:MAG: hypothetical protein K1X89_32075 [Myxococcaceae bacterium]|nr:hypothetical protein [Myxococcaceae bacterium]
MKLQNSKLPLVHSVSTAAGARPYSQILVDVHVDTANKAIFDDGVISEREAKVLQRHAAEMTGKDEQQAVQQVQAELRALVREDAVAVENAAAASALGLSPDEGERRAPAKPPRAPNAFHREMFHRVGLGNLPRASELDESTFTRSAEANGFRRDSNAETLGSEFGVPARVFRKDVALDAPDPVYGTVMVEFHDKGAVVTASLHDGHNTALIDVTDATVERQHGRARALLDKLIDFID